MKQPPRLLDGAKVLKFADLLAASSTGRTRHVVQGREVTDFAALAIARYQSDPGFYLFYCDEDWNAVTDTYHETIDEAIEQATFEFGAVAFRDVQLES